MVGVVTAIAGGLPLLCALKTTRKTSPLLSILDESSVVQEGLT